MSPLPREAGRFFRRRIAPRVRHAACLLALLWLPESLPANTPSTQNDLEGLTQRVEALETTKNVLLAVSGGTLLALVVGWFRLLRKADAMARARLNDIVESRPGMVQRLVDEHDAETRLRRKSKIGVVSDSLQVEALLLEHGFRDVRTLAPHDATEQTLQLFDAIVLDLDRGVSQEDARSLIKRNAREFFLAYSSGRVDLPPGRATFANSPITLYARLLELLRFQAARREA